MRIILQSLFLISLSSSLFSQAIDEDYNAKIKEYTTDERFLPSSVLDLIDHPDIPSPRKHFGQIIGAPKVMHNTTEIYQYYKVLDTSSPKLKVEQIGTTEEGRPINLVIITSEETINETGKHREQLSLFADPRKIDAVNADKMIQDTKAVFYLNGGLHSTEMGSPEMLMELAYRLITDPSPATKNLLDNLIILINPVSEPDGRDKQVDWYYRYTRDREEYRDGFPKGPPYWGKYIFHDNNRDGLQVSQALTKAIFKIYFDWHPAIMLDLHESVPLLYISTGTGPYNEFVDPVTIGEWQVMANHEQTSLAAQGLPGVFTWAFYDGWWPGYAIWVANNHNSIGRFYETFGNAGGTTYLRDLKNNKYAGDDATSREWYRPDPPTEQVYWSSRNNTNYMEAGVLAGLKYAADNRVQLLRNFYQKGVNNLRKGAKDDLKCFVIPKEQKDPNMSAYLVNQLMEQKIEVHQATDGDFMGDYVVLLEQPYRNLAVSLLSAQKYPKEAKFPPYDDIAWTLGYQYGVEVNAVDSIRYKTGELSLVEEKQKYIGTTEGDGENFVIDYKAQNNVLPALYSLIKENKKVSIISLDSASVINEDTLLAGGILIKGISQQLSDQLTNQFGLDLIRTAANPDGAQHNIKLPRIAIYHSWYNTQDEGWSRYTFEQRGIPYASIDKDDLKAGKLNSRFDIILIPRTRGSASQFIQGINEKFSPMPYTKTDQFPSHGFPDATDDMTGGPGFMGMANLKQFVDAGGVLITLDNSSSIIAESGITPEIGSFRASGLFHPGSVVTVKVRDVSSPILYGFPETFHVFRGNGPLLEVEKYNRNMMVLQYGTKQLEDEVEYEGEILGLQEEKDEDKKEEVKEKDKKGKEPAYLISGMVRNENSIIGHGGIFNVPLGKGRIIAFTFDPLHRYLNHHDAPLLWNAIMHWDSLK